MFVPVPVYTAFNPALSVAILALSLLSTTESALLPCCNLTMVVESYIAVPSVIVPTT